MLDLFKLIASWLVPLFVVTSMLNVGLTQKPSRILHHLRNYRFLVRMVATNLIIVPALMVFTLQLVPVEDAYAAGLIVFSLAAGAPFLIKLTAASEHDLALGATVLMVLMAATVALMPILLPLLIEGLAVDSLGIVRTLLLQMIAPMLVGMAIAEWLDRWTRSSSRGWPGSATLPCTDSSCRSWSATSARWPIPGCGWRSWWVPWCSPSASSSAT